MNDHTSDDAIGKLGARIRDMVELGPEDPAAEETFSVDLSALSTAAIALTMIKAVNHAIEMDKRLGDWPDSETTG